MADLHRLGPTISFAVFTADLHSEELRKNGVKVRLERQPFQVLAVLLEHPHELVTREELRKWVWPQDTFVDFDHALNTAVAKIRMALGDDADNPRFVETVPRRGYRFILPLKGTNGHSLAATNDAGSTTKFAPRKWVAVSAVAGIVLVALATLAAYRRTSAARPARVLNYTQLTSDGQYKEGLLTDGPRLYFMLQKSGGLSLAQVSAAGGQVSPIPVPFADVTLTDIAPDNSGLLVHSDATYVLPLPTGVPRRLGDTPLPNGTWSPDGQQIAYTKDSAVYIARRDGSAGRMLTAVQGTPSSPRWSPDGKLLRFSMETQTGERSLWEVQNDGSRLHQLFAGWNNPPVECCGQWTPDGKYFIFLSWRDASGRFITSSNVWAVREKNEYFRRVSHEPVPLTVTSTSTTQVYSAVPSRDGKRLYISAGNQRYELVRYDKQSKRFLPYLPRVNGWGFTFSKDGEWVAYIDADNLLWRCRRNGTECLQLTFLPMYAQKPKWSPDGKQVAFAGSLPNKPWEIFRITRDGGNPEQLTEGKHGYGEMYVSWSPDGKSLMVGERPFGPFAEDGANIKVMDLQTRKLTMLPGSARHFGPQWSEDGRHVLAVSNELDILLFDLKSQKWSELAKGPSEWRTWSHDGQYVYFGSVQNGEQILKRVRIRDHKVEIITGLKDLDRNGFQTSSSWVGIAPDDSPLALRDVSSYDIFALDWELP